MKLDEAVRQYVQRRRLEGVPFVSSETTLKALCKHCGDIELRDFRAEQVSRFLSNPLNAPVTKISKFSAIKGFANYSSTRGNLPLLLMDRPPRPSTYRRPYIYTRAQVKAMLANTDGCQALASSIGARPFRMLIVLLYATGATVDEILTLQRSDVDLRARRMTIKARCTKPQRIVPIGTHLTKELSSYLVRCSSSGSPPIINSDNRRAIDRTNLRIRFRKLCSLAGVENTNDGFQPRLQDFRYTFAVHRLNDWIRAGKDLNNLLPALSTYMGYSRLTKAEAFLAYVPDRFRDDLNKISPRKGGRKWSDDQNLMSFLAQL